MTTITPNNSRQRSLEQERAKAAWNAVAKAKRQGIGKKYKSTAKDAPANIQQNGLGQTLAFWRAKHENHQDVIYDSVSDWVKSQIKWAGNESLLDWIVSTAGTNEYRRATSEAMAFLGWVKRFAEAELED